MRFFARKKPPPSVGSGFAQASAWVMAFGEGDDSVLAPLLELPWNREDGSTATLYRLCQEAWGERISRLGQRFTRDMGYGRNGATTAFGGLRSGIAELRRFARWNAFDDAARTNLLGSLAKSLEHMGDSMEEEVRRSPSMPASLQAEIKDFRRTVSTLASLPPMDPAPAPSSSIPPNRPESTGDRPRRRLLVPMEKTDAQLP